MSDQFGRIPAILVGFGTLMVVIVSDSGQALLQQLHTGVAHHAFHVALPLLAFVIFAALVARDVRLHGWPAFSWQLEPAREPVGAR